MNGVLALLHSSRSLVVATCLIVGSISTTSLAHVHMGATPGGPPPLGWSTEQIEDVIGYSGSRVSVDGEDCLRGSSFGFKVRDPYAFDIEETVWLEAELQAHRDAKLMLNYDGAWGMNRSTVRPIDLPKESNPGRYKLNIPLPNARFANLGYLGTDLAISTSSEEGTNPQEFTICTLSLRRTHTTPAKHSIGVAVIRVVDEAGNPVPARLGLYDSSGRLPLPSDDAVGVRDLVALTRIVPMGPEPTWPAQNRHVFYVNGRYRAQLPEGHYQLIAARGLEYHVAQQPFSVRANQTENIRITLRRWTDMAAKKWYSGDDHIHYARLEERDDKALGVLAEAEDLKVSNILQMGNIAQSYFHQRDWKAHPIDGKSTFVLVPGQEDPRTSHLGHTIQLNIRAPVRALARYLLYHEVFGKVRAQGGLPGYAHIAVGKDAVTGMAIDMPFGLVDFAEIMNASADWGTETWFDFLNLGYKLAPSGGSDYPYGDIPGVARTYVRVEGPFTVQSWFDGLKDGNSFVTNGPMLDFTINGYAFGSLLQIKDEQRLVIKATATMNPDIGCLAALELIEQGEVVKAVSPKRGSVELELHHSITARHGTWFVVRARGARPNVVALSAPIYVLVDGQSFWKPTAVPTIVAKLKMAMRALLSERHPEETESWETRDIDQGHWSAQRGPLKARIDQAIALYDDLERRAAKAPAPKEAIHGTF